MNNIIETAIASGTDGLAVTLSDDNALNAVLGKAMKQRIPVIAFSQDNSTGAAGQTCRLAFIGQNFFDAGDVLGKRMIEAHHVGEGDLMFTPVEAPQAIDAVQRHAGVARALDEVGATAEILATINDQGSGRDDAVFARPRERQGGHRPGPNPGVPGPAGFAVDAEILTVIENGSLTATLDQQPYCRVTSRSRRWANASSMGSSPPTWRPAVPA